MSCHHQLVLPIPKPSTVDLENAATRLGFELAGTPFRTQTSLLCPVSLDGQCAFVKVTNDPEELTGARALEKWAGNGAVRVLARQGNVVVLEHAGLPLRAVTPDDTAATTVLCAVAEQLHSHTPEDLDEFPTLRSWFSSLFADTDSRFDRVRAIADRLLGRSYRQVLLHGDLHHDNVLDSPRRGWLAIDPKGLAGPREFDYCNIFTNPTPHIAVDYFDSRVRTVADTAGIDPVDLLHWIACWGALSGIWHLEDGDVERASIPHAIAALAMERLGQCRTTHENEVTVSSACVVSFVAAGARLFRTLPVALCWVCTSAAPTTSTAPAGSGWRPAKIEVRTGASALMMVR